MSEKIEDLDIYAILKLSEGCTTQDIKAAYRKTALECHPDKNPDNPEAAKKFIQLGEIIKLLLDPEAKKAYDNLRKARLQNKIRLEKQDSVRKKFREDLERREKEGSFDTKTSEEKLKAQIERLRKEANRQLEEELESIQRQLLKDLKEEQMKQKKSVIKLKWHQSNAYTQEYLYKVFEKYGEIENLVVASKGKSALVEFSKVYDSIFHIDNETGDKTNPFKLTWITDKPLLPRRYDTPPPATRSCEPMDDDFEEMVLKRMMEAQKKKDNEKS